MMYYFMLPFRYISLRYKRLKRMYKWAKFMETNYEWDASYIYSMLHFKLKEIQQAIYNDPYLEHTDEVRKSLKALAIAIQLAYRLDNNIHSEIAYRVHEAKWGKLNWETKVIEDRHYAILNFSRDKAITDEDKIKENEEFRANAYRIEKWYNRDQRNFFAILQKYMHTWWT